MTPELPFPPSKTKEDILTEVCNELSQTEDRVFFLSHEVEMIFEAMERWKLNR